MISKMPKAKVLISEPRTEVDMSRLLMQHPPTHPTTLISEVEIKPGEQTHVSLGNYDEQSTPKGFSLELNAPVENADIIKQITKLEFNDNQYELVLHIANYSTKTISAEIWQL
jgi:hypothetical protein